MGEDDRSFSDRSRAVAMETNHLVDSAKLAYHTSIHCAGILKRIRGSERQLEKIK